MAAFVTVLRQVIGELRLAGSRFAPSYLRGVISRLLSYVKLLGKFQLAGFRLPTSYWGSAISSLLSRVKLLRNYNLQGLALPQAIVALQFPGSSYWRTPTCRY